MPEMVCSQRESEGQEERLEREHGWKDILEDRGAELQKHVIAEGIAKNNYSAQRQSTLPSWSQIWPGW